MPLIINELAATILPRTDTVTTDTVPTQTSAPEAVRRTIELIRLAKEREERLAID